MPVSELQISIFRQFDGQSDPEDDPEGASEVVAYGDGRIYITNGNLDRIDIYEIDQTVGDGPDAPAATLELDQIEGFDGVQSVAVKDGLIAVAVSIEAKELPNGKTVGNPGVVAFFDAETLELIETVEVGNLPDSVSFSPDGMQLSIALEGEFNEDSSSQSDPKGGVALIDVSRPGGPGGDWDFDVRQVNLGKLNKFDTSGLRIGSESPLVQDVEPEYVTYTPDGSQVLVTLQENNAIAVIDAASGKVVDFLPAGTIDHSIAGNEIDPNDRDDSIALETWDDLVGLRIPDAIVSFESGGQTYFMTANEGDGRGDFEDGFDEARVSDLHELGLLDAALVGNLMAAGAIDDDDDTDIGLERLTVSALDGDTDGDGDIDVLNAYGSRSFTIFDMDGNVVFDSGAEFAEIIADIAPDRFQTDEPGDPDEIENRSDAKGVEPEAIEFGEIDGTLYAFIGLERDSGIIIYDITDPANAVFVDYIDGFETGNIAPEVLEFVPTDAEGNDTGSDLLIASYEVSGTTVVYEIAPELADAEVAAALETGALDPQADQFLF